MRSFETYAEYMSIAAAGDLGWRELERSAATLPVSWYSGSWPEPWHAGVWLVFGIEACGSCGLDESAWAKEPDEAGPSDTPCIRCFRASRWSISTQSVPLLC